MSAPSLVPAVRLPQLYLDNVVRVASPDIWSHMHRDTSLEDVCVSPHEKQVELLEGLRHVALATSVWIRQMASLFAPHHQLCILCFRLASGMLPWSVATTVKFGRVPVAVQVCECFSRTLPDLQEP